MAWKRYLSIEINISNIKKTKLIRMIAFAIILVILFSLVGCEDNTTNSSSVSSEQLSSMETDNRVGSTEGASSYPYLEITDKDKYTCGEGYDETPKTYLVPRYINLSGEENEQLLIEMGKVLYEISKFDTIERMGYSKGMNIDFSNGMLGYSFYSHKDSLLSCTVKTDKVKRLEENYPKTKSYIGPTGNYLEKKYVDETVSKYFCKDTIGFSHKSISYNYNKQEEVYALEAGGVDLRYTIPLVISIKEDEGKVKCVISIIYSNDVGELKKAFNQPFSNSKVTPVNTSTYGNIRLFEPIILEDSIKTLNKIKFTFCKEGDTLKIHSAEYV